jgi:hypothetical protein
MGEEPVIKVKGGRQTRVQKKEKLKYSHWFITLSTNQRYKEDDPNKESDSEIFEEVIQDILQNVPKYVKMPEGETWSKEKIEEVDCDFTIEWGSTTNALHCHALVKIKHRSRLQLDYASIKEKVKEELGVSNVYMQTKLVKAGGDNFLLEYIDKVR